MASTHTKDDLPVLKSRTSIEQRVVIEIFNDPPDGYKLVDCKFSLFCVCLTFYVCGEVTARIALV